MDDFVHNKLTEWGLEDYIETFKANRIEKKSLYLLEEQDIRELIPDIGPRATFREHLNELKSEQESDEEDRAQVLLSTSTAPGRGKRKLDPQPEPMSSPMKRQRDTALDDKLKAVEGIMNGVLLKLPNNNDIEKFLEKSIRDLKMDKKVKVGVFGRTGAGKSSLINAVIGERDLLPTGILEACTSVIIKVKANTSQDQKYVTKIKLITKEEFNNEMELLRPNFGKEKECDDDFKTKLTALFGDEWKDKSLDNLKESRRYKEILKLLEEKKIDFTHQSLKRLQEEIMKYTRNDESTESKAKTLYWPVVKCVTIKVPNNDLLQHVTLMDLPGNGDCNRTRNEIWKNMVGSCGTVWIVAEITRAASEAEAWEIFESTCRLTGNGGECCNLHFICTKSDQETDKKSTDEVALFKRKVKKRVATKITENEEAKKHFSSDCFEVFTVSSKEFFETNHLEPEETEIPELQRFLQSLNSQRDRAFRYVSAAYGILSLMKGARTGNVQQQTAVRKSLLSNIEADLKNIQRAMVAVFKDLEESLSLGVEKAKELCVKDVQRIIMNKPGSSFHMTLRSVVVKNGVHKPKKGKEINLNTTLSSFLTDSIDEKFRKAFPNDQKDGSFYDAIHAFSLNTKRLNKKYTDVKLLLIFLEKEEEKLKMMLCEEIRQRKKSIYNSLTETVEKEMQDCYKKAKEIKGEGSLDKMREIIMNHVQEKKDTMFDEAKENMLYELDKLMEDIAETLTQSMQKVINLSFEQDLMSAGIPDITDEFSKVEEYYNELGPR